MTLVCFARCYEDGGEVKEGTLSSGGGQAADDDCTEALITTLACLGNALDLRKSFPTPESKH